MLALAGCERSAPDNKARDCEPFVKAVQVWLRNNSAQGARAADPAALAQQSRELAERYDTLVAELEGLPASGSPLTPLIGRYAALARTASSALRQGADALDRDDFDTARRRRVEFDDAARAEAPLVAEINALCR